MTTRGLYHDSRRTMTKESTGPNAWSRIFASDAAVGFEAVLLALAQHGDFMHGTGIYVSINTIATGFGCERRKIEQAITALRGRPCRLRSTPETQEGRSVLTPAEKKARRALEEARAQGTDPTRHLPGVPLLPNTSTAGHVRSTSPTSHIRTATPTSRGPVAKNYDTQMSQWLTFPPVFLLRQSRPRLRQIQAYCDKWARELRHSDVAQSERDHL
jgi:hypothetical protein